MPSDLRLAEAQQQELARQHRAISAVAAEGVQGASPLARVVFDGVPAAMKLYSAQSIYANEVEALTRLRTCRRVPALLAHGTLDRPLSLPGLTGTLEEHRFWLCRRWIDWGSTTRLPLVNPAAFGPELDAFLAACNHAGVVMADAKRTNFVWDGAQLCWLDFGWCTPAPPAVAIERNQAFAHTLLRRLGW